MAELTYRYFYAGIIFNILFSMMGYAFTIFPSTGSDQFNIPIDQEGLANEGILFLNATAFNLTYNGDWVEFTLVDEKMRISFRDSVYSPEYTLYDGITIQRQRLIQSYFDSWLFPDYVALEVGKNYQQLYLTRSISNSTIIQFWETNYNFTRFRTDNDVSGFISTLAIDDNNITKAIYETGNVTITLGELQLTPDIDISTFARWYWNTLVKFEYEGFPAIISGLLKLIIIVNLVSGILVMREQLRL